MRWWTSFAVRHSWGILTRSLRIQRQQSKKPSFDIAKIFTMVICIRINDTSIRKMISSPLTSQLFILLIKHRVILNCSRLNCQFSYRSTSTVSKSFIKFVLCHGAEFLIGFLYELPVSNFCEIGMTFIASFHRTFCTLQVLIRQRVSSSSLPEPSAADSQPCRAADLRKECMSSHTEAVFSKLEDNRWVCEEVANYCPILSKEDTVKRSPFMLHSWSLYTKILAHLSLIF